MKKLVDIVNFNSDASCLASHKWLEALEGGEHSKFVQWLQLYIRHKKKIVLGLTGATVADLTCFNPESLALIRANSDLIQIIARPFTHDIALLRTANGFRLNLEMGMYSLAAAFGSFEPYYLPPEFMLTTEQIALLHEQGIVGTFINPQRYPQDLWVRIPSVPYRLTGLFGAELSCVPVWGSMTYDYLAALDHLDAKRWNAAVLGMPGDEARVWRDGESWLLFPQGLEREAIWLDQEDDRIERSFLNVPDPGDLPHAREFSAITFSSYPLHSLDAWLRELKMLRYVRRIGELEEQLDRFGPEAAAYWLLAINSDILSSVEKPSIKKRLKVIGSVDHYFEADLHRCERGFEGAEYLALLERQIAGEDTSWLSISSAAHMAKARARTAYCLNILSRNKLQSPVDGEDVGGNHD